MSAGALPLARTARRTRTTPDARGVAGVVLGGTAAGLIAGHLALSGHSLAIAGLLALFIPVLMWRRTETAPVVLLAAALLIEQYHQTVNNSALPSLAPTIPITSSIPLFTGLGSLHLEPADLLLLGAGAIYLFKPAELSRISLRSPLARSVGCVMGMVVVGMAIGAAHHFNFREALQEGRPYVYLGAVFALTALLIRTRSGINMMLWALVLAETVKSIQGVVVYIQTRSWATPPEAVLGHEEAYFFGLYILLVAVLWLFDVSGPLRKTATRLLPLILFADLVNNRRAAWLIVGGGLLALTAIGYVCLPQRRRLIHRVIAVLAVGSAVYFPVYWNQSGTLSQPARAIKSAISPDPRDQSSDLYREQENLNLEFNIRQGGVIGKGFGIPIDYALPIVNIQAIDPQLAYIPHNTVLYQLMRMGLLGSLAFWSMLGCGIVAGCRIARAKDRLVAAVGALVACGLVGYALEGATDQGFYFYRIAFVTGALLGLCEVARRMSASESTPQLSGEAA